MSIFDFDELDNMNPVEELCKEWYLSAMQSLRKRSGDVNVLTDPKEHDRITEVMLEFPPRVPGLENAWKDLRGPKAIVDWDDLFLQSIDTCVRYHDRYYPVTLHKHSFFEIVFLVRGKCTHHVGDDMIEMQQGDVVIVPPGTLHAVFSYSDENIIFNMHISSDTFEQNFLSLLISQNILGKFFRQTLYSKEDRKSYFIIQSGDYFLGDNILADIWREMKSELPYQRDFLNTQVKLLFLHLLRYYSDSMFMAMISTDDSETIVEMMTYIQNNFRDVTVDKLCEEFSYSKRQIFRHIRQYTGSTLGELQKELRMKHAARLLTNSKLTVEQIAVDCGYKSNNYFYTVFKDVYGTTPLEYRKIDTK